MVSKVKVGDRITMKKDGPFKRSDAKDVAGQTGTIITAAYPGSAIVKFPEFNYTAHHTGYKGTATLWAVSLEDIESFAALSTKSLLPEDAAERKKIPVGTGVLDYFSAALAEIAKVSYQGNQQHNPGQSLHWARNKSTDQADTIIRHFLERGTVDPVDGMRHSAKLAWRALALLQLELEAEGYPIARGASYEEKK